MSEYERGFSDGLTAARIHLARLLKHLDAALDQELEDVQQRPTVPAGDMKPAHDQPCTHPARAHHGRHEWYVDPVRGGGYCRACGAQMPAVREPLPTLPEIT